MTNVLDLVRTHGIQPRRVSGTNGGEYSSPCPGCGGSDRFRIWPEENADKDDPGSYWCRQCGRGGDTIQFLRDFENLSFREALRRLGREIPQSADFNAPSATQKTWSPAEHEDPDRIWQEKAKAFATWCFEQLFEHREALQYILGRGFKEETISRFGLGWNPGKDGKDLYRAREAWGLPTVKNAKGRSRPLWLPRGAVILCWQQNRLTRLRIRRADPVEFGPRYYVVPGSSMATMVIPSTHIGWRAYVVVESELDAILVHQVAGDLVDVVALGSAATKPDQEATKALRKAAHVMVALDFDAAGAGAYAWWGQQFPDCERWPPPMGKDPGEAFKAGVDLRAWVLAGLPDGLRR